MNCPFATKVANYQRDGNMRVDGNQGGAPNYFPNSFNGPQPDTAAAWHKESTTGDVARYETGDEDNFSQCGQFYRNVLSAQEKERLTDNIAGSLAGAQDFIIDRAISNFSAADANYGRAIRRKVDKIKAMSTSQKATSKAAPLNPPRNISKI